MEGPRETVMSWDLLFQALLMRSLLKKESMKRGGLQQSPADGVEENKGAGSYLLKIPSFSPGDIAISMRGKWSKAGS